MNFETYSIDSHDYNSIFTFSNILTEIFISVSNDSRPIIFLCIGTDRSTGDSLGPLVGEKLKFLSRSNIGFYGNLENPVHAKNLQDNIDDIYSTYINPFIIAIDACLGSLENVGKVFIENKPIMPGSAMKKDLPKVGDISITGIVNISGILEFMVLQNTRLYTVMKLADLISNGIYSSILRAFGTDKSSVSSKYIQSPSLISK